MSKGLQKICLITLLSLLSGCAIYRGFDPGSQINRKAFHKGFSETWDAVLKALDGMPLDEVNRYKGLIKTKWVEKKSQKKDTGLFFVGVWRQRSRLLISVTSVSALDQETEVVILVHTEEKAPGGTQAYDWQRKGSNGVIETGLFTKIAQLLKEDDS